MSLDFWPGPGHLAAPAYYSISFAKRSVYLQNNVSPLAGTQLWETGRRAQDCARLYVRYVLQLQGLLIFAIMCFAIDIVEYVINWRQHRGQTAANQKRIPRCTDEQKLFFFFFFHDNLTLPKSAEKCWLQQYLNSHLRDTGLPLYLLSYRVHRDWRRVFIQFKCTRYSRDNLTLIHERMCSVVFFFTISESSSEIHMNRLSRWTGIPKVRFQIPLESTFFSWLRQCQIIVKKKVSVHVSCCIDCYGFMAYTTMTIASHKIARVNGSLHFHFLVHFKRVICPQFRFRILNSA